MGGGAGNLGLGSDNGAGSMGGIGFGSGSGGGSLLGRVGNQIRPAPGPALAPGGARELLPRDGSR